MLNGAKKVFTKEIREMVRDRRVLMATVVMPIFIIALFFILIGFVSKQVSGSASIPVAIVGMDKSSLTDQFPETDLSGFIFVESETEAKNLITEKSARLALIYPSDFQNSILSGKAKIVALFDADDPLSMVALSSLRGEIFRGNIQLVRSTLQANNLSPDLATPISMEEINVAKSKDGTAGSQIIGLLPYLIVLWSFYGGMSIVSDLVAGEKERGTMETLLISPIRRAEVAIGKVLALSLVCTVSGITTLVGIGLLATIKTEITKDLFPSGLNLSPGAMLALVLVLVSLSTFFSALMVSISAYSRNIRESQTYLSLLSFVILMPAIFSQFIGFTGSEKAAWVSFTPVLNSAMTIRGAVKGEIDLPLIFATIGINGVLSAIFLFAAIQLFRKEEILLRV